jgi:hypothetical protein
MTVYYFLKGNGEKVGSTNNYKISHLAKGRIVFTCNISEFDGQLLSDEWVAD